jgi:amino acid adenylation domain-containing protein
MNLVMSLKDVLLFIRAWRFIMENLLLPRKKDEGFIDQKELEKQINYWRKKLEGDLPELSLPFDFPKNNNSEFLSQTYSFTIPSDSVDRIKNLVQLENVTPYTFFMTIIKVLIYRYSGEEDILVGTNVPGQGGINKRDLENILVLRTQIREDMTFLEALHEVENSIQESYRNQKIPFTMIMSEIANENKANNRPIFQVMMNMGNIKEDSYITTNSPIDLHFIVREIQNSIQCSIKFNKGLFSEETIVRMAAHFNNLIEGSILEQNTKLTIMPLLSELEKHKLLIEWNSSKPDYPRNSSIPQLFNEQVKLNPNSTALIFEGKNITYKELNFRANKIANYLMQLNIKRDQLVAIYLNRTPDLIATFLGVLKAGGAYVPIDLSYPRERIEYILEDSQASFFITTSNFIEDLPHVDVNIICLDLEKDNINVQSEECIAIATAESLAYVMYTSGSTGKPKGVEMIQRGIVRLVINNKSYAELGPQEVILNRASVAFDVSAFEIYGALLNGGKLVLMNSHKPSFEQIAKTIQQYSVTILRVGPELLNVLLEDYSDYLGSLRQVFCGGEVLPVWLARKFKVKLKWCNLINAYGPTENAVNTTSYSVQEISPNISSIPIGRPVANDSVYILDKYLQPVPIGVCGELYLSGDGIARGYLNRPELTRERFIKNPFSRDTVKVMYKSGDLGRFRPDGNIEFLGRTDDQVKIRGVRIELGEIENIVGQFPGVRQSITTTFIGKDGTKEVVSYVVMNKEKEFNQKELRSFVREKLPEYLVPTFFVELEEIPVTPVGKLDYKRLPSPTVSFERDQVISPRNPVEKKLVSIWESLLDYSPISIRDNFFDLGGNSLLAMRLFSLIEKNFSKRLPVSSIFQEETIENLASLIFSNNSSESKISPIVAIQPLGTKKPLFCVHGGGGEVLIYRDLTVELGNNQPVYGLRYVNRESKSMSVEDLAKQYIKEVRRLQPEGPYHLLGFCYGGAIAYEMAYQLISSGQKVNFLTIINFEKPGYEPSKSFKNLALNKLRRLYNMPLNESFSLVNRKIFGLLGFSKESHASQTLKDNSYLTNEAIHKSEDIKKAINEYKPKPYPGKMVLIRGINYDRYEDKLGWENTNDGYIQVNRVFAPHHLMLKKPHVGMIVKQIEKYL